MTGGVWTIYCLDDYGIYLILTGELLLAALEVIYLDLIRDFFSTFFVPESLILNGLFSYLTTFFNRLTIKLRSSERTLAPNSSILKSIDLSSGMLEKS